LGLLAMAGTLLCGAGRGSPAAPPRPQTPQCGVRCVQRTQCGVRCVGRTQRHIGVLGARETALVRTTVDGVRAGQSRCSDPVRTLKFPR
jgi:hypothetical protein